VRVEVVDIEPVAALFMMVKSTVPTATLIGPKCNTAFSKTNGSVIYCDISTVCELVA
jgi:hypothetical protein